MISVWLVVEKEGVWLWNTILGGEEGRLGVFLDGENDFIFSFL